MENLCIDAEMSRSAFNAQSLLYPQNISLCTSTGEVTDSLTAHREAE